MESRCSVRVDDGDEEGKHDDQLAFFHSVFMQCLVGSRGRRVWMYGQVDGHSRL